MPSGRLLQFEFIAYLGALLRVFWPLFRVFKSSKIVLLALDFMVMIKRN